MARAKERIERLLDVYTLEEILESNDLTNAEVVEILYEYGVIDLPTEPVSG